MALDLSAIAFKVDTSELDRAGKAIGDLVVNVSKLDKAARDAAQTEAVLARAAKDNAKASLDNAKAQDVRLKSTIAADKADQAAEKAVEKRTKAIERSSAAAKKNADILQLQSDTYEFILEGFSKGDAKVLAMAKSTGQLSDSLKKVLTDIRQFSKNTFDQTETGLDRMTKAAKESTIAQSFLNEGFNLTSKQARELSNDLDRLNIRLQHQGKSYQEIVQAQAVYKQQFIDEANAVNRANYALAAVEKQRKDVVTATNYLTQADQKMAAALNISNAALDKSGTDSLVKYEMALRKSGLAQDVVTQKLATYKSQLAQVQAQEAKRAEQNLTRAISPQLMDIGVSLYSGQNPLTVLIQQSGQLVDLFQLSGVEATKLGEAMRNSFYSMVPAIGTVAKGLSSLFFGMFLDAGRSITSFIGNVTGMNKVLQHTDDILYLVGGRATWFSKALATVSTIAAATFGTGIFAIVAGLTALAVGLKQVITENNDLAKAFALSGGSIGASHTQVLGYVKTLAEAGATTGQATEALIAMAKAGVFASDEILLVSNSAIQMQQGFGIAVEDTVKQFAKLKEKPVESLLEIAKSAGQVSPEIIKMVQELDKAGKSSDAAALAMKAYADSNSASFKQMRENYNGFALFVIDLGRKIKQFFSDTFKTLFIATDPNQQLEEQLGKVRDRIKEVSGNLQRLGSFGDPKLLNSLKEQERSLISQIGANVRLAGEEERRKLNNIENAKQLEFAAGIEKQLSDIQDSRAKKSMTLSEFQNKYVEDAIKKANATLKLDKEKINLTETQIAQLKEAAKLEWQEANKPKKGTSENYYESLMREATNNTLAAANATEELTKSEKKLLEVLSDSRFSKLTKQQKEDVVAKYEAAIVVEKQTALTEKLAEAEEHRLKLLGKSEGIGKQYYSDMQKLEEFAKVAGWSRTEIEELTRAIFKSTPAWKAYEKALDDVGKAARKFEEDSIASQAAINNENQELDFRISLLGKTAEEQRLLTREYEKETKLRQVQTQLAKKLRDIEVEITQAKEKGLVESDYKELIDARVQAEKDAADKTSSIYKETAVKFREDFDAEVQKVKSGLTDSIVTALFEGGKAGSKKLRDVLTNILRQKITMVVDVGVNAFVNSIVGGAVSSVAGSVGSNLLGTVLQGTSLYSGLTSGTGILGSIGSFLGMGSTSAVAGAITGAGASGLGLSATAGGLGLSAGGSGLGLTLGSSAASATAGASGIGAALSAIPGWGWAIAGIAALAGLMSKSATPHMGAGAIAGFTGGVNTFGTTNALGGFNADYNQETANQLQGVAKLVQDTLMSVDKLTGKATSQYEVLTAYADDTSKDAAWGNLIIKKLDGSIETTLAEWSAGKEGDIPKRFADGAEGYKQYLDAVAAETKNVLMSMDIPDWMANMLSKLGDTPTADQFNAALTEIAKFPNTLLEMAGTSRDALISVFVDGLQSGDSYAAGRAVADNLVASIEKALYTNTSSQIFDLVNQQVVSPLLNAIMTGAAVSESLTNATIDRVIEQATTYAETLTKVLNDPAIINMFDKLKNGLGNLLGTVGDKIPEMKYQLNDTTSAVEELTKAEKDRANAARDSANKIVEEQKKVFENLTKGLEDEAFQKVGGNRYGFDIRKSEVESTSKFVSALDSATASFEELKNLNLGEEFSQYAEEINKIIQSTKVLLADQLARSRLLSGDVSGAMQAKNSASTLNYSNFMSSSGQFNAGAFNVAYAREQALAARGLIDVANDNALVTKNIAGVISSLNAYAYSDILANDIRQSFIQGVREASGTLDSYVVRDAINAIAGAFTNREINSMYVNKSDGLPAIAAAYAAAADLQKVEMINGARYMGEFAISYAQSMRNLQQSFNSSKITAEELTGAVSNLEAQFGKLEEYAVTPVQIVMARVGASSNIATAGLNALNKYFGQLSDQAALLAENAKLASEPIAVVSDVVGRLASYSQVFEGSANAVINGFTGMLGAVDEMSGAIAQMLAEGFVLTAEQTSAMMADAFAAVGMGKQGLKEALTYGSQTRKALLIARGASIAGENITTAEAAKVAEDLVVNPVFEQLSKAGLRDVAMLLDGLKAFDPTSFEKAFIRMSDALNKGALNEEQYAALFDESIKIYTDHDAKVKQLTDAFSELTDAAKSLADQLLIDAGYTTLTGGQTLVESQRQYNELMYRALQGDVTAASQLGGATQSMLTIAKQQATTEQDYARVFGSTIGDLRTVESMPLPARIAEPIQVVGQTNEELIAEIKALREEIRAGNAQIASNTDKTVKSLQDFQVNGLPTTTLV